MLLTLNHIDFILILSIMSSKQSQVVQRARSTTQKGEV